MTNAPVELKLWFLDAESPILLSEWAIFQREVLFTFLLIHFALLSKGVSGFQIAHLAKSMLHNQVQSHSFCATWHVKKRPGLDFFYPFRLDYRNCQGILIVYDWDF